MVEAVSDPIAAGREAASRRAWDEAYELLSSADSTLPAEDLQRLADAAFWSGRLDEALSIRERAYKAYLDEGSNLGAAGMALRLSLDYLIKANLPLAGGWLAKGERILEDEDEALEHGQAAMVRAEQATLVFGKFDEAVAQAERAYEIGKRFGDADLQALALVVHGISLVYQGELDAGLALLDEASTSAPDW